MKIAQKKMPDYCPICLSLGRKSLLVPRRLSNGILLTCCLYFDCHYADRRVIE